MIYEIISIVSFIIGIVGGVIIMGYLMEVKQLKYLEKLQNEYTIIDNETKIPVRII